MPSCRTWPDMNAAHIPAPPVVLVEPIVRAALVEDLGLAGDITTGAVIPAAARLSGAIVARQAGVLAGLDAALLAFRLLDPMIKVVIERPDGSRVTPGSGRPARWSGAADPDRRAGCAQPVLPPLGHCDRNGGVGRGAASARPGPNRLYAQDHAGPAALEKYAVRAGGGSNHRFGLETPCSSRTITSRSQAE